ncbi:SOS response-associated peptidase family protein [Sphingosinithalassobacter sp. CS137]|uniref:SOS response-associated peptidase family protein n=1 Tax=Sphingosinithalassobacter sp. CS137 TaxID=2762748 RepID=UPI00165DD533|nr:SOS response-associated peptidase family protein [Sphingosinithalassobacter sp. CS137]
MCNEAARQIAVGEIGEGFAQMRIPLDFPEGLPNLEPTDSVRITDATPIVRAAPLGEGMGAQLVQRRWSWPGQGGRPIYNYRSEGRDFRNAPTQGRCLIPLDGFYEFREPAPGTGTKPKRKERLLFTPAPGSVLGDGFLCVAGLWRAVPKTGEAFTMLTCEPGPDVAPHHRRQVVLMPRTSWAAWLRGDVPARELIEPTPAGMLDVRVAPRSA